ncbi:bifunctional precorrin-2 dehydrogenase/sirohydrochlorin ferrochelatase [Evansella sp. AB-P1]|uniref:precorrin-2 dehydrogenase/sirohydrochlorin ferrochelatase family protein n=1 Tax=Evansella sp. AB-P1 TaxID=3037653 RepID=UPI00241FB5AC|nr:bifunctional precorrin-2 dehydrogenase/sirohydrochlorin ferrochelatase [Evansella sp. AB-P1]MDG5786189.1 bifunctional precorrin-2 dehydrogenase/sirohydrochlorin ferrochelatase [Evansella sp. AB-P1]
MSEFTPCMVKLANKRCTVIGGGKVAFRKIVALLSSHCKVKVISPFLCPELEEIISQCEYEQRPYKKGDTEGAFIVVAATDKKEINMDIYHDAIDHVPFLNIVDDQSLSNFFIPSILQRGPLQIAISTTGASPIVTKKIFDKLANTFGEEYEPYLKKIKEVRNEILMHVKDPAEKKAMLKRLSEDELLDAFMQKDEQRIQSFIRSVWKEE